MQQHDWEHLTLCEDQAMEDIKKSYRKMSFWLLKLQLQFLKVLKSVETLETQWDL